MVDALASYALDNTKLSESHPAEDSCLASTSTFLLWLVSSWNGRAWRIHCDRSGADGFRWCAGPDCTGHGMGSDHDRIRCNSGDLDFRAYDAVRRQAGGPLWATPSDAGSCSDRECLFLCTGRRQFSLAILCGLYNFPIVRRAEPAKCRATHGCRQFSSDESGTLLWGSRHLIESQANR